MKLLPGTHQKRRMALVAPEDADLRQFAIVRGQRNLYDQTIEAIQRFRGEVYLGAGHCRPRNLTSDRRHVQPVDRKGWHLLSLRENGDIAAWGRVVLYPTRVRFSDLMASQSTLAKSEEWGPALREAVEAEIDSARRRGVHFAELGGWAIAADLRCSLEAMRILTAGYALGEMLGGVLGISTTNVRYSSSILRRTGGKPLVCRGRELPQYTEPLWNDKESEVLRFDSAGASPSFQPRIRECMAVLQNVPVIAVGRSEEKPSLIRGGYLEHAFDWAPAKQYISA
jgi:hypothetical protein